jgi:hypothetical protein
LSSYRVWQLPDGSGKKTVYMQVRDNAGNIANVTSSIETDNVIPIITFDPDNKYPNISWNIKENINSAEIKFSTDQLTTAYIDYGIANVSDNSEGDPNFLSTHDILIKNLLPDTTYKYRIRVIDELENIGTNPKDADEDQNRFYTFHTGQTDEGFDGIPTVSDMTQVEITASSAKITWKTKVPTTSWVDYGTTVELGSTTGDDNLTTAHIVEITNLTAGQTYYYRVRGFDAGDNEVISSEYSFKAVMKPVISNIIIENITATTAEISWSTNVKTDSDVLYGESVAYTNRVKDVGLLTSHRVTLRGLLDNVIYNCQIEARDDFGSITTSQLLSFRTNLDTEGPKIEDVMIDIVPVESDQETAQIIISWKTSKPATTRVEYGEGVIGGTYDQSSAEDISLNSNHTVIIKGLNPAATYHFRIVSRDKRNNESRSTDYTIVTPAKQKSIWQILLMALQSTFSWVSDMPKFWANVGNKF